MHGLKRTLAPGVLLAGLGVLAGVAISSGAGNERLLAQRNPPVEVRTEVIRRTVNVYRREHLRRSAGAGSGAAVTNGIHGTTGPAVIGRTRTSAAGGVPTSSRAPTVSTRTSGAPSSGATGAPRTRSSGGGGGERDSGGGHDD